MFRDLVTSEETLRAIIGGDPSEVARKKELPALEITMDSFLGRFLDELGVNGFDDFAKRFGPIMDAFDKETTRPHGGPSLGVIPDYAFKPHGGLSGTMIYWKRTPAAAPG